MKNLLLAASLSLSMTLSASDVIEIPYKNRSDKMLIVPVRSGNRGLDPVRDLVEGGYTIKKVNLLVSDEGHPTELVILYEEYDSEALQGGRDLNWEKH